MTNINLWFIDTVITKTTSKKCFREFCDTLELFRELFLDLKEFY